jgi:thiamine-monophosphate kinase
MPGEFDFISWIRTQIPSAAGVVVGPGDDCAVLAPSTRDQVVTTDTLMDGVDFKLRDCGPVAAGRKAMLVNLSDIAAMAGRPTSALVSLCLPKSWEIAVGVFEGIRQIAHDFQVAIIGGDTNSWDGPLVISITMIGEVTGRGAVLRSGARPGDWLFVTGPLGGSITGRHLNPVPRIREAIDLHDRYSLTAMIDLSDGLARDLSHIARESRCGVELITEQIPIHRDATTIPQALSDGEDFELVFAVAPEDGVRITRDRPDCFRIGQCVESGLWLIDKGQRKPLIPAGWQHTLDHPGG